jgi:hypothetical protein
MQFFINNHLIFFLKKWGTVKSLGCGDFVIRINSFFHKKLNFLLSFFIELKNYFYFKANNNFFGY